MMEMQDQGTIDFSKYKTAAARQELTNNIAMDTAGRLMSQHTLLRLKAIASGQAEAEAVADESEAMADESEAMADESEAMASESEAVLQESEEVTAEEPIDETPQATPAEAEESESDFSDSTEEEPKVE
jgi:Ser-tRNA(Ala) deacylase AlaX